MQPASSRCWSLRATSCHFDMACYTVQHSGMLLITSSSSAAAAAYQATKHPQSPQGVSARIRHIHSVTVDQLTTVYDTNGNLPWSRGAAPGLTMLPVATNSGTFIFGEIFVHAEFLRMGCRAGINTCRHKHVELSFSDCERTRPLLLLLRIIAMTGYGSLAHTPGA